MRIFEHQTGKKSFTKKKCEYELSPSKKYGSKAKLQQKEKNIWRSHVVLYSFQDQL